MNHNLCDACECAAWCMKNGCIPLYQGLISPLTPAPLEEMLDARDKAQEQPLIWPVIDEKLLETKE